ncbi:RNA polymerase sigma factor SigF [Streptacidiphilus sp. PB12-B1b]|uniref:RNA polymerase sigma factor SigF n=1 Tax=Streptacidiphilus sp. PB12-B1b TaxID=2705012 RepID=UPI0015FD3B67|nr:RNA polymerase sigma factor SigF [Streptacidiphilus sp. PB12-B1b]QMU77073.1 RNA polymerase sigma factor SigF [Streptacidiphilus sp. PB12-B1b]
MHCVPAVASHDVPPVEGAPLTPSTDPSPTHSCSVDPRTVDPRTVGPADARAMSKVLFARMAALEEGTHEYQYVRNTLVELNLTLVRFAAGRFRNRSEPMEDIVQVGTIGLIKAIDRFDPEREIEFTTFALPTITGEIKRFFRDTSWAVHVPRRLQELRLALARATDELSHRLDRAPSTAELAAHLNLTVEEVSEGLVAANGYSVSSLDAQPGDDDSETGASIADRVGAVDPGMEGIENLESLKPLMALLSQRERTILSLRFGAELTQSQIGAELGISQMQVSRLLARAVGTLRAHLLVDQ